MLSAIALALSFDLIEKSRPVYDGSPGTLLLPQSGELSDSFGAQLSDQSVAAILIKILLSLAAIVVLILVIANHQRNGALGFAFAILICAGTLLLWLWPLLWSRRESS